MNRASSPPRLPGSYLVVELTNRCSLACVHCAVSDPVSVAQGHHARLGTMAPTLFRALLDDLEDVGGGFDTLILFWLGEPLLHPRFGELWRMALRSAARVGTFQRVEVHTNGTHLDERVIRVALNEAAVPQTWAFTLDAATPGTYRAVKGRDRFVRVRDNARAFLRAKARRGARWPRVVLQFIVGSNNVAEARAFRDEWVGFCERVGLAVRVAAGRVPEGQDVVVFFRQLDCPSAAEQTRENAVFQRLTQDLGLSFQPPPAWEQAPGLAPCSGFWKSPTVSWDGRVTTCTRDATLRNAVGSLTQDRFSDLWWGPVMAARRVRVAQGDYSGLELCQDCFVPRSLNHAALSADDIARQAAFDETIAGATRG